MAGTENHHGLGVVLVLLSALAFSLAGIFTKLIEADSITIACWRGLFGFLAIVMFLWIRTGRNPVKSMRALGWRGWCLATVGALASLAFISAFKMTYVANVAIIYATAPFIAGLLEWGLLRRTMRPSVMLAAAVSIVGIIIMADGSGSFDRLAGDGMAVLMTIGMALFMVLVRVFRDTPVVLAGGVSGLQLFLVGWLLVSPLQVGGRDIGLLILFGLVFAMASVFLIEGTKRIAASESGLLGAAETPFAILFAGLILAEWPPLQSLAGGSLVMLSVAAFAVRDWIRSRSREGWLAGG
ncbi:DMT family transporter [Aestuariispira insulae]|uniref:EamA domain-containing membrane protein RarD n=1 Tax=Aestuariispira insulae TaxID=1461337 RepID=A0A3D9HXM7_9PROT|nr:DMT family transporter [Aestuariispira insulae]RED53656.1 EamA domain-containing membrane protein RarD [Aestuariispira insulae]